MEPVAGAVEAGISSAAVAAESAVTASTTAAEGAVQAGAAAAEGVVQATGQATETAAGVIPNAVEGGSGVVDEGLEGAAQEGLATSAETTLEASGPDAALQGIVSGETLTPSVGASSTLTETGMDQRAIDAANVRINQLKAEGQDVNLEERHRIYDEELEKLGGLNTATEDFNPSEASVSEVANPNVQPEQTMAQTDSAISEEIRNDPLFQQRLEEERAVAQTKGEEIDEQKISQEALAKYNQSRQAEQQQLTPEQQKINQLEEKLTNLTAENAELKANIAQINAALTEIKDVLDVMIKSMAEKEQDPKEKESLLALLLKIAAIIVIGSVIEGGKTAAPPLPSTGR